MSIYFAQSRGAKWTENDQSKVEALCDEILGHLVTINKYKVYKVRSEDEVEWDTISNLFQTVKSSKLAQTKLMEVTRSFYRRNLLAWVMCVQGGPPLDLAVALLDDCPNAAKETDIYGANSLEYSLVNNASMDVVEALLKKCPSAAEGCRKKPFIADVIKKGGSVNLIHTVMAAWPQNFDYKDFAGILILHETLKNGASFDIVRFILEKCPDAVKEKDPQGLTALRCGIANNASSEIIKVLLNASDEDENGDILLFYALEKGAALEVIQALASAYPEALKKTDDNGMTILHYGMLHGASRDTIKWILDAYPVALETFDHENKTPFYYALSNHYSVEDIEIILKKLPDAAKMKDDTGMTALYYGIINKLPVAIIKTILVLCPDSVKIKDKDGKIPLRCALENDTQDDLLETMLMIWPEAALEDEKIQQFLLHFVFDNNSLTNLVKNLFTSCPELGKITDNEGKTLLRHSLEKNAPIDIFQIILEGWPEAAKMKDDKGSTPMHFAIGKGLSIEFIKLLLISCPESAKIKDNEGKTPLRHAMDNNVSIDLLLLILKEYPDIALEDDKMYTLLHYAIDQRLTSEVAADILASCPELAKGTNTEGFNSLHYAIQKEADIEVIRSILQAWPEAGKAKDSKGKTALHHGILSKAPANVIETILDLSPESAMIKDNRGKTPLFYCVGLNDSFDMVQTVYERYKPAAYEEDNSGFSPIRSLVVAIMKGSRSLSLQVSARMLQLFVGDLRDNFPLRCLFQNTKPQTLQCILCILGSCQIVAGNAFEDSLPIPVLDLNQSNFLEMLVDLDSDEAAEIFFQIKKQVEPWDKSKPIEIRHTENATQIAAIFVSDTMVQEETWRSIADQAILSSVEKLKAWGQTYGRLFGKFRVDRNAQPKYQSDTCVVVLGTELVEIEGSKVERNVAMKFLADDNSFKKELEQRQTILNRALELGIDAEKHIVLVEEAFTSSRVLMDLKISHCQINVLESISNEIVDFKNIRLNSNDEESDYKPIRHVLVMKQTMTNDLNDMIYHHNVAGKKGDVVRQVAIGVAKTLQFLNEQCRVMHGDVKPLNFLPVGIEGLCAAFGLDNSSHIEEIEVIREELRESLNEGQKKASEANYQYDMWCFGVMTYQLCTGKQLFQKDNREVNLYELFRIQHITDQDINRKLNVIPNGEEWGPLLSTLKRVMKTNSADRPKSWNEILDLLEESSFAVTIQAEEFKRIASSELENEENPETESLVRKVHRSKNKIDEQTTEEKNSLAEVLGTPQDVSVLEAKSEIYINRPERKMSSKKAETDVYEAKENAVLKRVIDDMKRELDKTEAERANLLAESNKVDLKTKMRSDKVSLLESKLSSAKEASLKAEISEMKKTKLFYETIQILGKVKTKNRQLMENLRVKKPTELEEELSIAMEAKIKAEEKAKETSEEFAVLQKELSFARKEKAKTEAVEKEMTSKAEEKAKMIAEELEALEKELSVAKKEKAKAEASVKEMTSKAEEKAKEVAEEFTFLQKELLAAKEDKAKAEAAEKEVTLKAEEKAKKRSEEFACLQKELSVAKKGKAKAEASELDMALKAEEKAKDARERSEKLAVFQKELSVAKEDKAKAEEKAKQISEELAVLQKELSVVKKEKLKAEKSGLEMRKLYNETFKKMEEQKSGSRQLMESSKQVEKDVEDERIAEIALLELMQNGIDNAGGNSTLSSYEEAMVIETVLVDRPLRGLLPKEVLRTTA